MSPALLPGGSSELRAPVAHHDHQSGPLPMAAGLRQQTANWGPAGLINTPCPHPGHEWGKLPVPRKHAQEKRMIVVPLRVANSQGRQPWPEEALQVLRGASADLPPITLVTAGLCLPGPAGGWLFCQRCNDHGGSLSLTTGVPRSCSGWRAGALMR